MGEVQRGKMMGEETAGERRTAAMSRVMTTGGIHHQDRLAEGTEFKRAPPKSATPIRRDKLGVSTIVTGNRL